ncbi:MULTISPECIES: hypothetical protein [Bacillus]|uniref:Acetolactate synthase small subunit n=1 Tax=Bacillus capparidis TaxID=1840411 RepID=A0ABS4CTK6_9BACI|nr:MULTISPECIES: hypothetical protein [Bacillus]MBP1080670.1 acetolactate synthase small subunit [Bacillus capparidis]MED1094526.1 hypothetical protein [Bacillus capparidis]
MKKLLFILICAAVLSILVDNRYRVLNVVLGQDKLRHYFIHSIMKIPFIRNRFIEQAL